jgi:hypothetical protein
MRYSGELLMKISADSLVRQHLAYASAHPEELKQFNTIFDHMVFYFCSVHGLSKNDALRVLDEFGSDPTNLKTYRYKPPASYMRQPANSMHLAIYSVSVQALLT